MIKMFAGGGTYLEKEVQALGSQFSFCFFFDAEVDVLIKIAFKYLPPTLHKQLPNGDCWGSGSGRSSDRSHSGLEGMVKFIL